MCFSVGVRKVGPRDWDIALKQSMKVDSHRTNVPSRGATVSCPAEWLITLVPEPRATSEPRAFPYS